MDKRYNIQIGGLILNLTLKDIEAAQKSTKEFLTNKANNELIERVKEEE